MSYIVSPDWLKERMEKNPEETVIVDTRFQLNDPDAGRRAYLESHIPGAVYLDLKKDLSSKPEKHGGSHPLPDMDMFAAKLGKIGIDNDTTVVAYGKTNDIFPARLWWLLHYMGHDKVYVLDGGYDRWVAEGHSVTDEIPISKKKEFKPQYRHEEVVDMKQVKEKLADDTAILIDSRSRDRYLGKTEPMHPKAGHIPGAKNMFWKGVLDADGHWKNVDELKEHFADLPKDEEIIVSCGSGVSATPNIMGLKMAGFKNIKLYPGSYSDWISYDENEVETKEE